MRVTLIILTALIVAGCSTHRTGDAPAQSVADVVPMVNRKIPVRGGENATPRVTVYRMSGHWQDNVPVQLGPDGKLSSYPAPSDISDASRPVYMGDGLWLDRRGVSENSVFTRYTYAEYSSLPSAPSPEELMASIIRGARVTRIYRLPMPVWDCRDSAKVREYINTHPSEFNI